MLVTTTLGLALIGFAVGIIINLLADELPARRYLREALRSPFVSRQTLPHPRGLFPRRGDGTLAPFWLWSGIFCALRREWPAHHTAHRSRRVLVEAGLTALFPAIGALFPDAPFVPLYLVYAAFFVLIALIDIEHRWVLGETLWPLTVVAAAEAVFAPRFPADQAVQGALLGFGLLFALYLGGIVYGRLLRRRQIGRTVLGFGDVLLGIPCGIILGWQAVGPAWLIMMILGGAGAGITTLLNRRAGRHRRDAAIPYAPYIMGAAALMLYLPTVMVEILRWITRLI